VLPEGAVDEFASTYQEWHYIAGGLALGVLLYSLLVAAVYVLVNRGADS